MPRTLELTLLGTFDLRIDGKPAESLRSNKAQALLCYLVVSGRIHSRTALSTLLWGDTGDEQARGSLRQALLNLTELCAECFTVTRQSVAFDRNQPYWLDTERFEAAATRVVVAPAEIDRYIDLDLYRGDFLEGFFVRNAPDFENWILGMRARYREMALQAFNAVAIYWTEKGELAQAILYSRRLLEIEPWHEGAHRRLMLLLMQTGQRTAALEQYRLCRQLLADELGIEPEEATQALYAEIKSNRWTAPLPVAPVTPSPGRPNESTTAISLPKVTLPAFLKEDHSVVGATTPFVGRSGELAVLAGAQEKMRVGQGQIRFVTGGAGQGKSILVQEFIRQAQAKDAELLAITGTCNAYSGSGDPYLPFREALALLAGEVESQEAGGRTAVENARRLWAALPTTLPALVEHAPDLIGPIVRTQSLLERAASVGSPHAPWFKQLATLSANPQSTSLDERRIFSQFTAALKAIAKEHPLLLILEDLHWVDVASSGLLFHLSRAMSNSRILIIGTYRPDEVALGQGGLPGAEPHPLAGMLGEFKRQHGAIWLDLDAMSTLESRQFVEQYVDTEPNLLDTAFRSALFQHTGGHALFTVELLREMQARGDLHQDSLGRWVTQRVIDWRSLPAKVEGVIERQLAGLESQTQTILRVACVQGQSFAAEVIAQVMHLDEQQLIQHLSQELGRKRRLVNSQDLLWLGPQRLSRYSFRHYLFQRYLYQNLDEMERTYLHQATAQTLEQIYASYLERYATDLAYHFYEAGFWEQALQYSTLAGDYARALYALGPALEQYLRAFEAARHLDRMPPPALYRARGLTYDMLGEFRPALSDLETVLHQAESAGDQKAQWQALLDLGMLWAGQNYDQTGHYYQRAFELAQKMDDPVALANSFNRLGNWRLNSERPLEGLPFHRQALAIFQQLGDRAGIADTLDLLAMASNMSGDLVQGMGYYRQAIELFYALDQRAGLISSLSTLAMDVANFQTDTMIPGAEKLSVVMPDGENAIKLAKEIGHRSGEIYAMQMLAKCVASQGAYQRAFDLLEGSLSMAQEIDHRQWLTGAHFTLGAIYSEVLALPQAVSELQQACEGAKAIQSAHWLLNSVGFLTMSYVQQGEFAQAEKLLQEYLDPEQPAQTMVQRLLWRAWAELALARGDGALALQVVDQMLASATNFSPESVIPRLAKLRGDALCLLGQLDLAEIELTKALAVATRQEALPLVWRIHGALAHLYQGQTRLQEAKAHGDAARGLLAELAAQVPQRLRANFYREALHWLALEDVSLLNPSE